MGLGERIESLLAKVPGYEGYRAKEDRRDADRRVREHLVAEYAQRAERVERIARDLARQRRLVDVASVDEFARGIRHFVNRVETATYGYGGLFSDRDVDEAALDQLQRFDESLLSGLDELDVSISNLEAAFNEGKDLEGPARAGSQKVRALLDRLDLRDMVIETGKPEPEESVLRVLQPRMADKPAPAFTARIGDAVSILGDDYLIDAVAQIEADDDSFRLVRLTGGAAGAESWLYVPSASAESFALLTPTAEAYTTTAETRIGQTAYTLKSSGSGRGELTGAGGSSGRRIVSFSTLASKADPSQRAVVVNWGNERQVLVGKEVNRNDVEVFARPASGS